MTQFLITAVGSYGDVHPMVGLGAALAARGEDVKIVANPYFAEVVASAGLTMLPISTAEDYVKLCQHPDLWHPIGGSRLVLKHAAGGLLRPLYDILKTHYVPGRTVLCAHGLDLASRVAGNKLGAPVASVDLAPAMFWTLYDSPRLKGALTGPRVPRWIKRMQFWASDTLFVRPLLGGDLNGLRRELGLTPVKRIFSHWLHDTDLVLGLFPDWFGPPQPDWPPNMRLVGFPLWDIAAGSEGSARVSRRRPAADCIFTWFGQPGGPAILCRRRRSLRAVWPARHPAYQICRPTSAEVAVQRATFRFCAA
jgi:hypothetical protein